MGRKRQTEFDARTVERLEALKKKWGLKTDRELAARLKVIPSHLIQWKRRGLTKMTATLIDEILGENPEEKGQYWLLAA